MAKNAPANSFRSGLVIFVLGMVFTIASFFAYRTWATSILAFGNSIIITTTTTNSTTNLVGTVNIPTGRWTFQNNGLQNSAGVATTNTLIVLVEASLDNTNFIVIGQYQPSVTNPVTDTFIPANTLQNVYMKLFITATNNVTFNSVYQQ